MKNGLDGILANLPNCAWVYIFKDRNDKIIYIGKSVNIKSRVSSYFNWIMNLNFAKKQMVLQIKNIEYIETKNELEALVLETNLIKANHPKYNILMKDDKNLAYIKITNDPIPQIIRTRQKKSDWEYFGPYPSTFNVINTIELVQKIFKIRNCNVQFEKSESTWKIEIKWTIKNLPCLEYYIFNCPWPCLLTNDKIDLYKKNIDNARKFLKWDTKWVVLELEEEMKNKAKNLEFEEATKLRDSINSLKELHKKQIARDVIAWDNDIIVILEKYGKCFIWVTEIRDSQIVGINNIFVENKLELDKDDIFSLFIQEKYIDLVSTKINLIIQENLNNVILDSFLKQKWINIDIPKIWNKLEIINFTKNNLLNFAYKRELSDIWKKTLTRKTQENILQKLNFNCENLKKKKEIIFECFDISHLSWTNTVASKSVIINWKIANSKYKKYTLKTIKWWIIDDFKSMEEILERRALEIIKTWIIPDLIIIDWWKWQLSSAQKWIDKIFKNNWFYEQLNICSLAKREEEIFVNWLDSPILLSIWSQELMLIQKIRDEAHRFAINFNRQKRDKEIKKNILEEIEGFWPKTRSKLLKLAWSVDNIKNIPKDKLSKVLNKTQIEKLEEYWIILNYSVY